MRVRQTYREKDNYIDTRKKEGREERQRLRHRSGEGLRCGDRKRGIGVGKKEKAKKI